ncbi:MAG: TonB-dependent receptor plug domain-containing protein, partial [Marinirhabdus sp.]
TKQGGGYGDARINIRGFDTQNSAVLINGVPVNDMENGVVYWSNWAGLSDVASGIQVQRGLGTSKLVVSSVGGTINVVTRSADRKEGGSFTGTFGNNGFVKNVLSYSTGLSDSGWSGSFLLGRAQGGGYVDGTQFSGANYFAAVGYMPNSSNRFEFTVTGAPQWHHQRSFAPTLSDYIFYGNNGDPRVKYNSDWGMRNGKEFSFRRNFYHKPILSLNWDWDISENSSLATVAYASFGRGGGTGEIGRVGGARQFDRRLKTANGLVDVNRIIAYNQGFPIDLGGQTVQREQTNGLYLNQGNGDRSLANGISRRASVNSHNWYGLISNFNTALSDNVQLDFGIDLRNYKGFHYRRVNDRLGADAYLQTDNRNNPDTVFFETYGADQPWWVFGNIDDEEKIDYYNVGHVNWAGVFGQLEYTSENENFSAFVQGAVSNQGFAREEFFNETPPAKTDYENILGGQIKGGFNFNIDENHNIFANGGYYSKQPLFDAVYINFSNTLNPALENEKVMGTEVGYGYRSRNFRANVNLYRTSWADRFESTSQNFDTEGDNNDQSLTDAEREDDDIRGTANLLGVEQVHMGIELDARLRVSSALGLTAMVSIGDWQYKGNVSASFLDENQNVIVDQTTGQPFDQETLYLDGVKVGDAAQFTASLGADVAVTDAFKVDANYRFANNLYAAINATDFDEMDNDGSLELPSFGLANVGVSYSFALQNGQSLNFRANMNNVFNTTYISESDTNIFAGAGDSTYDGISTSNRVYFGFGRTWNASVRYEF